MTNNNVNTTKVDSTISKLDDRFVNETQIVDNLTTDDATKVLTAKQGKVLNDAITQANTDNACVLTKLSGNAITEGMAATYELTQGGTSLGKIDILKDKFFKSLTLETVGATPSTEETNANLVTGDQYLLVTVNNDDLDNPSTTIIPSTFFDLQTGDNVTIDVSNSIISIKSGYVESVIDDYLDEFISRL